MCTNYFFYFFATERQSGDWERELNDIDYGILYIYIRIYTYIFVYIYILVHIYIYIYNYYYVTFFLFFGERTSLFREGSMPKLWWEAQYTDTTDVT